VIACTAGNWRQRCRQYQASPVEVGNNSVFSTDSEVSSLTPKFVSIHHGRLMPNCQSEIDGAARAVETRHIAEFVRESDGKYCNVHVCVCLYVWLRAYLPNQTCDLYQIFVHGRVFNRQPTLSRDKRNVTVWRPSVCPYVVSRSLRLTTYGKTDGRLLGVIRKRLKRIEW